MRVVLTFLLAICCIAVIIAGSQHWNNRSFDLRQNQIKEYGQGGTDPLLNYASNWPKESYQQFENLLQKKKPFKIQIAGSAAMGKGEDSWPEMVEEELIKTYGKAVEVKINRYDLNSLEFIQQNKQKELIDSFANLILFEPFFLKNNGEIAIEDTLLSLDTIINEVKQANPKTVFVLQPAHPLFNANYYPLQVEELKQYAEDNKIPFLNHWKAWPDQQDESLIAYLSEDNNEPSKKGHQIWAEFITNYFINKE
ncbi:SGNH/GDSL hydrolase family protein [Cytobacillus sp. NCCP-133]|uniref:SGNH/GDSL hydrolase family protein n=1 Tax=Cytobacillus sp. NCCP-133 TaxID=766848 RepID=UPI00222E8169|nr:SGNH/GDSL hydrolase family protein [Cytobacillus sp. NCCP-133]GLB58992.1 hypothetical protein NCCP133_11250 [Cytobacillus sp. NCCP-133]